MRAGDFFKRLKAMFFAWYRARRCRQVFFWSFVITLVLLIITRVDPTGYVFYGVCGVAILASGASIVDTWMSRREFKKTLKSVESSSRVRQTDVYGEVLMPPFGPAERKQIRQKLFMYMAMIALKISFIIIFIILIANGGTL